MSTNHRKVSSSPAVRRMPAYLNWLLRMRRIGKKTVSTTELADGMNTGWIVVRKDIALTGIAGRPRVGYDVDRLVAAIRDYLGWHEPCRAALVGVGSLGTAILGYGDFEQYGLRVESAFDSDPAKTGTEVFGLRVQPVSDIPKAFRLRPPRIAILCVPDDAAQPLADLVVRHGVRGIWNFANVALEVPDGVAVQHELLADGFALLSAKMRDSRVRRARGR